MKVPFSALWLHPLGRGRDAEGEYGLVCEIMLARSFTPNSSRDDDAPFCVVEDDEAQFDPAASACEELARPRALEPDERKCRTPAATLALDEALCWRASCSMENVEGSPRLSLSSASWDAPFLNCGALMDEIPINTLCLLLVQGPAPYVPYHADRRPIYLPITEMKQHRKGSYPYKLATSPAEIARCRLHGV